MAEHVLKNLGIDPSAVNFNVHIVSSEEIRELNKIHRGKNKATDVLSFPLLNIKPGQAITRENFPIDYNLESGKIELGDIVINENEDNRDFLIEHGLLHLLGIHHEEDE